VSVGILIPNCDVEIPPGIDGFAAFRRWTHDPDFPEKGRIDFIAGQIEVGDMVEDPRYHGGPKTEIARVLANRVKRLDWGQVLIDATRVSVPEVGLSVEPDILAVSHQALATGRVALVPAEGRREAFVELEGPPELVVEVLSASSVRKDSQRLWREYYRAGIPEYWTVDARAGKLAFQIWIAGPAEYLPADIDPDRFQTSPVLQTAYRLDQTARNDGRIEYDLRERTD